MNPRAGCRYRIRVNAELKPDPVGTELITYLPSGALAREAGITTNTLQRWARLGLVQTVRFGQGITVYRAYDALRLVLGIGHPDPSEPRTEEATKLRSHALFTESQDATLPAARAGEPWEYHEDDALIEAAVTGGEAVVDFCLEWERSFAAARTRLTVIIGQPFKPTDEVRELYRRYRAEIAQAGRQ